MLGIEVAPSIGCFGEQTSNGARSNGRELSRSDASNLSSSDGHLREVPLFAEERDVCLLLRFDGDATVGGISRDRVEFAVSAPVADRDAARAGIRWRSPMAVEGLLGPVGP